MYCTKCGSVVRDDANFCGECGNPINRVQRNNGDVSSLDDEDLREEASYKYFDNSEPNEYCELEYETKSFKPYSLILPLSIGIILGLALILGICYLMGDFDNYRRYETCMHDIFAQEAECLKITNEALVSNDTDQLYKVITEDTLPILEKIYIDASKIKTRDSELSALHEIYIQYIQTMQDGLSKVAEGILMNNQVIYDDGISTGELALDLGDRYLDQYEELGLTYSNQDLAVDDSSSSQKDTVETTNTEEAFQTFNNENTEYINDNNQTIDDNKNDNETVQLILDGNFDDLPNFGELCGVDPAAEGIPNYFIDYIAKYGIHEKQDTLCWMEVYVVPNTPEFLKHEIIAWGSPVDAQLDYIDTQMSESGIHSDIPELPNGMILEMWYTSKDGRYALIEAHESIAYDDCEIIIILMADLANLHKVVQRRNNYNFDEVSIEICDMLHSTILDMLSSLVEQ